MFNIVISADLTISLVLTTFGYKSQEIRLSSPDHFLPGGAHGVGTRLTSILAKLYITLSIMWISILHPLPTFA